MTQQIKNFLVNYNKKTEEKELYTFDKKNMHQDYQKYIIGYKYGINEGEYIKILYKDNTITIENDQYASIPVYIYENNKEIVISSFVPKMIDLNIDSEMLYQYFAFGHMVNTNKTIYKNITTLEPRSKKPSPILVTR